jgi:hypothetical protein
MSQTAVACVLLVWLGSERCVRTRPSWGESSRPIPLHAANRKLWFRAALSRLNCIPWLIQVRYFPAYRKYKQWRQKWCLLNITVLLHAILVLVITLFCMETLEKSTWKVWKQGGGKCLFS